MIENAYVVSEEADYSCGDRLRMFKLEGEKIVDVKFASASLLADHVKGKTVEEALTLKEGDLLRFFSRVLKALVTGA